MEANPLTNSEKKELRGIGQRLKPHLFIGKGGLSESVVKEIELALDKNGLIKIRFSGSRDEIANERDAVLEQVKCELVGNVGKTALYFREMEDTSN